MKLYVHIEMLRNSDGELIQVVNTYKTQPKKYTYVIWE
jgi:hypothetical protein